VRDLANGRFASEKGLRNAGKHPSGRGGENHNLDEAKKKNVIKEERNGSPKSAHGRRRDRVHMLFYKEQAVRNREKGRGRKKMKVGEGRPPRAWFKSEIWGILIDRPTALTRGAKRGQRSTNGEKSGSQRKKGFPLDPQSTQ